MNQVMNLFMILNNILKKCGYDTFLCKYYVQSLFQQEYLWAKYAGKNVVNLTKTKYLSQFDNCIILGFEPFHQEFILFKNAQKRYLNVNYFRRRIGFKLLLRYLTENKLKLKE